MTELWVSISQLLTSESQNFDISRKYLFYLKWQKWASIVWSLVHVGKELTGVIVLFFDWLLTWKHHKTYIRSVDIISAWSVTVAATQNQFLAVLFGRSQQAFSEFDAASPVCAQGQTATLTQRWSRPVERLRLTNAPSATARTRRAPGVSRGRPPAARTSASRAKARDPQPSPGQLWRCGSPVPAVVCMGSARQPWASHAAKTPAAACRYISRSFDYELRVSCSMQRTGQLTWEQGQGPECKTLLSSRYHGVSELASSHDEWWDSYVRVTCIVLGGMESNSAILILQVCIEIYNPYKGYLFMYVLVQRLWLDSDIWFTVKWYFL